MLWGGVGEGNHVSVKSVLSKQTLPLAKALGSRYGYIIRGQNRILPNKCASQFNRTIKIMAGSLVLQVNNNKRGAVFTFCAEICQGKVRRKKINDPTM